MSNFATDTNNSRNSIRECYVPSSLLCTENGDVIGVVDADGSSLKWFTSEVALREAAVRVSNQGRQYVESGDIDACARIKETTCFGLKATHLQDMPCFSLLKVGVQDKGQVVLTDMQEPGVRYIVPFGPRLERLKLGKVYQLARDANRVVVGVAYNLVLDAGKLLKASPDGRLLDTGFCLSEEESRALDEKLESLGAFSALNSEKRLPSSKTLTAKDWLTLLPDWLALDSSSGLISKFTHDYFLVASLRESDQWLSGYLHVKLEEGVVTLQSAAHGLDLVAHSWTDAADMLADFFDKVSVIQYESWLELATYRQFFG